MSSAEVREDKARLSPPRRPAIKDRHGLFVVPTAPFTVLDGSQYPLAKRLSVLKKWGHSTHSFLTLYPGIKYFTSQEIEGFIPLTINNKFIMVIAQPVCEPVTGQLLLKALKDYADQYDYSIAAIPADETGKDMFDQAGFTSFFVGREPIYDLHNMAKQSKSVRLAVGRAKRKGLKLAPYSAKYRPQLKSLCRRWQDSRELPAMGFLFQLRPFEQSKYKRYFLVLNAHDKVVAFLSCSPIYGKNGWYLEDLIRDCSAPNGCTELLVTGTMEALAAEGYDMVTLGLAPLAGLPKQDRERPILNSILRFIFNHTTFIYHFKALEHFKAKFKPAAWEGNYLCHYRSKSRLSLVANLLREFMPYDMSTMLRHKLGKWGSRKA